MFIVSSKKYKNVLRENEELKNENIEIKKDVITKDIEINGLNIEIETLNKKLRNMKSKEYKIEYLFSIKERCKKARVKIKNENRILEIVEKRLIELER